MRFLLDRERNPTPTDEESILTLLRYNYMLSFISELWTFLKVRKKFWLIPVFVVLAIFGALIVLTQGSAIAPFIYTIF